MAGHEQQSGGERMGIFTVACAVVMLVMPNVGHAQTEAFRGRLSPLPVDGRTAGTITGEGVVRAELDGTALTVHGAFGGMTSAATRAHVHQALPGTPGPVAFALEVPTAIMGEFEQTVTLDEAQLDALRDGHYYVQIHTETNPGGELRGWLRPQE